MTSAEFAGQYRVLKSLTETGARTELAQELALGRMVMVHHLDRGTAAERARLLAQARSLDPAGQAKLFGIVEVDGTPVIVTDKCGIASLLQGAGVVVPHEVTAMSRAIERVLVEPGLQKRLAVAGREVASRLDWESPACEMESLYRQIALTQNQPTSMRN